MAASLIIVVPVVILFVSSQRYFVNGLQGAVKAWRLGQTGRRSHKGG
jgi:hypothetical protein